MQNVNKGSKQMSAIAEYREELSGDASGSSYFRSQTALRYPEDTRNERSAEALERLSEALAQHPLDDLILNQCHDLEAEMAEMADRRASASAFERFGRLLHEDKNRLFGRYGFDAPEDGVSGPFLVEYLALLQDCSREAIDDELEPEESEQVG